MPHVVGYISKSKQRRDRRLTKREYKSREQIVKAIKKTVRHEIPVHLIVQQLRLHDAVQELQE